MRSKSDKQKTKDLERSLRDAARQNSSGGDALAREFVRRAEREGLLDVAYAEVDSPVGRLLVAATHRGLVRVTFPIEAPEKVLEQLAASVSPRVPRHDGLQPRPRPGRLLAATVGSRQAPLDCLLLAQGGGLRRRRARRTASRQVPRSAQGSWMGGDLFHAHEPRRLGPVAAPLQTRRHHQRHNPALQSARKDNHP